jgi:hypothetical protein
MSRSRHTEAEMINGRARHLALMAVSSKSGGSLLIRKLLASYKRDEVDNVNADFSPNHRRRGGIAMIEVSGQALKEWDAAAARVFGL